MKIGLIGLPASGKSSCFSALTGLPPQASGAGERIGSVRVPEPRLLRLAELYNPPKITYPEIMLVDTDPLESGGGGAQVEKHLSNLAREAEAFAIVLQCFGDMDPNGSPLDPSGGLETVLMELTLADLSMVSKRLERIEGGSKKDRNANEVQLLELLQSELGGGKTVYELGLKPEQQRVLGGMTLVSALPLLVACNVGEDDLQGQKAAAAVAVADGQGLPHLHFCASLEIEIAQLPPDAQADFLADYGLQASATFLTAGEKEVHAWPVHQGATAPEAAGKIHTDLQNGFIRAETVAFADLDQYGSMAECRKHGLVRLEGKEYIVKDGDILDIRFSR
jgi:ribosome-binding ATPase YchF (GTP1/OBG family)